MAIGGFARSLLATLRAGHCGRHPGRAAAASAKGYRHCPFGRQQHQPNLSLLTTAGMQCKGDHALRSKTVNGQGKYLGILIAVFDLVCTKLAVLSSSPHAKLGNVLMSHLSKCTHMTLLHVPFQLFKRSTRKKRPCRQPDTSRICMHRELEHGLCEPPPAKLINMTSAQLSGCIFVSGGIMLEGLSP